MKSKETLKQNDIQFRYDYASTIMQQLSENIDITKLNGYEALLSASDTIVAHIFTGTLTEDDLNMYIASVYTLWIDFMAKEPKTHSYEDYEYAHAVSG